MEFGKCDRAPVQTRSDPSDDRIAGPGVPRDAGVEPSVPPPTSASAQDALAPKGFDVETVAGGAPSNGSDPDRYGHRASSRKIFNPRS